MTTTKKPLQKFYIVFVGFQRENLKTEFEIKLTFNLGESFDVRSNFAILLNLSKINISFSN